MKKALILGVTGQDGSYLADLLLEKGYTVHGMVRKSATGNTKNITHILENKDVFGKKFFIEHGDMLDVTSLYRIIKNVRPNEIYNEADQDHVRWSFDLVAYSSDITSAAVARLFEIVRQLDPIIRIFQPCTSNMFGNTDSVIQNENTPFNPQSIYAVAKTAAYYFARFYRQAFDMHISTGILYNHESPRRTTEYVTRKITNTVARIKCGEKLKLVLGDTSARIDWGYAPEYMEAAWRMLQQDKPDDYIIATGEAHSVEEFMQECFRQAGLDPLEHVSQDPALFRPTKTSVLIGDATKAREKLRFIPQVKMPELIKIMLDADISSFKNSSR
jgi:GDPmannose 4,6-dehydratase